MRLTESSNISRNPRLMVLASGLSMTGITDARITSTSSYSADWFALAGSFGAPHGAEAAFWSSASDIDVDIRISIDGGFTYKSVMMGGIDTISLNPILGVVRAEGRDFTARLLSANTVDSFVNQSASGIVSIVAARHGLTPHIVPTEGFVGRFDNHGQEYATLNRFSRCITDWDLLAEIARQQQFELFVRGQDLYFQPASITSPQWVTVRPQDVSALQMERIVPLDTDLKVVVKSWDPWTKKSVRQTAGMPQNSLMPSEATAGPDDATGFLITYPNLTSSGAAALAEQQLLEIQGHRRTIEFEMPGELELSPRDCVTLTRTGTDFDRDYVIETIERSISPSSGFGERIRARSILSDNDSSI